MASVGSNVRKLAVVTFFGIIAGLALLLVYRRRHRYHNPSEAAKAEGRHVLNVQPMQAESSDISSLSALPTLASARNEKCSEDHSQVISVNSNDIDVSIERNHLHQGITDSSDIIYNIDGDKQDQIHAEVELSPELGLTLHLKEMPHLSVTSSMHHTAEDQLSSDSHLDVTDKIVWISTTADHEVTNERSTNLTIPGSDDEATLNSGSTDESFSNQVANILPCSSKKSNNEPIDTFTDQLTIVNTDVVETDESFGEPLTDLLYVEDKIILNSGILKSMVAESKLSTLSTSTESEIPTDTESKSFIEPTIIATRPIATTSIDSKIPIETEFVSVNENIPTNAAGYNASTRVESKIPIITELKPLAPTKTSTASDFKLSKSAKTEYNISADTELKLAQSLPSKLPISLDHKVPFHNESKIFGERKIPTSSESKLSKSTESELSLPKKSKLPISAETKLHIYVDAKSDRNPMALSESKHPIASETKRRISADSKLPVLAELKKPTTSLLEKNIETNKTLSTGVAAGGNSSIQQQGRDERISFVRPPTMAPSDRVLRRKQMRKELIKARSTNPNWMEDWESSEAVAGWKTPANEDPGSLSTSNDIDAWKSSSEELSKGPSNRLSSSTEYVGIKNMEIFPTWGFSEEETLRDNNQSGYDLDISFDDNFVIDKESLSNSDRSILYDAKPDRSCQEEIRQICSNKDQFGAKLILKEIIPDCVLEREPLLEEEDDTVDQAYGPDPVHISGRECSEDNETEITDFYRSNMDSETILLKLKELANFLRESEHSGDYPPIIELLNGNLDRHEQGLTLASLQILVKFSSNPDIVPYLLAAKAPDCFLDLLEPNTPDDVQIAWLMFLSDVLTTSKNLCLTFSSLPISHNRVESPLTLYTALYGWSKTSLLKSRAFVLSRHGNELIARLASTVYICLMS